MILVVAATKIEMDPFLTFAGESEKWLSCVTGVGLVETAVSLMSFIQGSKEKERIRAVVNFGVAGAYIFQNSVISLLDLCLAERETLGDFGICFEDHLEALHSDLGVENTYQLDKGLFSKGKRILSENNFTFHSGEFVTVNCSSGTEKRGKMLSHMSGALCENMEGAAIARVCEAFSLPFLEIRCISNMVEDRDVSRWKLGEACERAAHAASLIVKQL